MSNSPRTHTLSFALNLNDVRPYSREICTDERFEIFCEAFHYVKNNSRKKDTTPLHAILRSHLEVYQNGHISFDDFCGFLREIAESAYLFTDNRLHRGKLTHVWRPIHQASHKWLTDLVYHCHGMDFPLQRKDDFELDAQVFLSIPSKDRPKFLEKWANYVIEEAGIWLVEQGAPLPDVTITPGIFPNRTIIRVNHQALPDAWFQLAIHDDVNNVFTMELEWDTGNGQPMLNYAIHERISEGYRHDECVFKQNIDEPVVYTLKIYPDPAIAA